MLDLKSFKPQIDSNCVVLFLKEKSLMWHYLLSLNSEFPPYSSHVALHNPILILSMISMSLSVIRCNFGKWLPNCVYIWKL